MKRCTACGNEFDDSILFCMHCGTKLPDAQTAQQPMPWQAAQTATQPQAAQQPAPAPEAQAAGTAANNPASAPTKPKGKDKKPLVIGIVIAVVVVIIAIVAITGLSSNNPEAAYAAAEKDLMAADFAAAAKDFERAGTYKESELCAVLCSSLAEGTAPSSKMRYGAGEDYYPLYYAVGMYYYSLPDATSQDIDKAYYYFGEALGYANADELFEKCYEMRMAEVAKALNEATEMLKNQAENMGID